MRRGLTVGCGADRPMTCTLTAELGARDARRLGLRSRRALALGRVVIALTRAGTRTARLLLNAAGRRALRRTRSVTVVVRGTASVPGARGLSLTRAFLIRR